MINGPVKAFSIIWLTIQRFYHIAVILSKLGLAILSIIKLMGDNIQSYTNIGFLLKIVVK